VADKAVQSDVKELQEYLAGMWKPSVVSQQRHVVD